MIITMYCDKCGIKQLVDDIDKEEMFCDHCACYRDEQFPLLTEKEFLSQVVVHAIPKKYDRGVSHCSLLSRFSDMSSFIDYLNTLEGDHYLYLNMFRKSSGLQPLKSEWELSGSISKTSYRTFKDSLHNEVLQFKDVELDVLAQVVLTVFDITGDYLPILTDETHIN